MYTPQALSLFSQLVSSWPAETIHRIPPPVITTHPTSVSVRRGTVTSVSFQCRAEHNLVYDWYKDGELFMGNCPTGQLVLPSVGLEHAGEYCCKVVNDGGCEASAKATLTFGEPMHVQVLFAPDCPLPPCSE